MENKKNVPNHQPVIKVGVSIGQMNILIQDEDAKTMGMTRMARMMRMSMKRRRMMIMIMIMIALLHLAATLRHGIRMHHRSVPDAVRQPRGDDCGQQHTAAASKNDVVMSCGTYGGCTQETNIAMQIPCQMIYKW